MVCDTLDYHEPTWAELKNRAQVIDLLKPRAWWNKHFDQLCKLISEQMLISKQAVGKE